MPDKRTITVRPSQYSRRRYLIDVTLYDTVAELRKAHKWLATGAFAGFWGEIQFRDEGVAIGELAFPRDERFGSGIVAHESVHAAIRVQTMAKCGKVGDCPWDFHEEPFAWLVGDVARRTTKALYDMGKWN